ncbi:MAG: S8 family serine peptidase [Geminicoccaceae bacterium]
MPDCRSRPGPYHKAPGCCASRRTPPAMKYAIDQLRAAGIATVIASGNAGYEGAVMHPGCVSTAETIGATSDVDSGYGPIDSVMAYSDSAPMVDLLAPGSFITSSWPGGGYRVALGTSMATPHVAGAFAALRSAVPSATPDQIEQALKSTGKMIDTPHRSGMPLPRIDVAAALEALHPTPRWHDFVSRGGSVVAIPDCSVYGNGLACWTRTAGGTLAWNRSPDGDGWNGFADLGGNDAGAPRCQVSGTRADCFVATSGNRLSQNTYNGSTWSGWLNRGGNATGQPSCVAGASNQIDCFTMGSDKALWRYSFNGKSWATPKRLGGSLAQRPQCVRRGTGIDCLVVDKTASLQAVRITGTKVSAFAKVGSGFAQAPQCLASGTVMDCFAQSTGRTMLKGYYNGTKWAPWTVQGSDVASPPTCKRITTGAGGFDCFWVSGTGSLIEMQRQGSVWQQQVSLGGHLQQAPVCLQRNGGARKDCFARGTAGDLQQTAYY